MAHTILAFLKLGSKENILDLYENGTVYINTIEYFRKIDDKKLRGDKYEGVSEITNLPSGTFKISGLEGEFKYLNFHIRESHELVTGNIYSIYCISSKGWPNPLDFSFDKRNLRFGSHGLMIKKCEYFIEQVESQLNKKGYKFHAGFVDYYDKEKVNRKITLFEKPLEFEYQKEFRFYVENQNDQPIKIQIGNLKDYAELFNMEDFLEMKLCP